MSRQAPFPCDPEEIDCLERALRREAEHKRQMTALKRQIERLQAKYDRLAQLWPVTVREESDPLRAARRLSLDVMVSEDVLLQSRKQRWELLQAIGETMREKMLRAFVVATLGTVPPTRYPIPPDLDVSLIKSDTA